MQSTLKSKDSIIVFRDLVERALCEAGVNEWTLRFDTKNKIVDAAIQYGAQFATECVMMKG